MRKKKKNSYVFLLHAVLSSQMFCPCVYMYVCICINPLKKRRKEEKKEKKKDKKDS